MASATRNCWFALPPRSGHPRACSPWRSPPDSANASSVSSPTRNSPVPSAIVADRPSPLLRCLSWPPSLPRPRFTSCSRPPSSSLPRRLRRLQPLPQSQPLRQLQQRRRPPLHLPRLPTQPAAPAPAPAAPAAPSAPPPPPAAVIGSCIPNCRPVHWRSRFRRSQSSMSRRRFTSRSILSQRLTARPSSSETLIPFRPCSRSSPSP